jgi:hypothetical protein
VARRGKQFEEAVYAFFRGLDAQAVVRFDHRVPDRDTGSLRQVDVWVEYRVMGHFPITVLVSCKDHSRPLDIGEVETFLAERNSVGASLGVIYSRSGFTQQAIAKAKANKISCCRLFDNEPPQSPSDVFITAYAAYPTYYLTTEPLGPDFAPDLMWRDILDVAISSEGTPATLRSTLFDVCLNGLASAQTNGSAVGRHDAESDLVLTLNLSRCSAWPAFRVQIALIWEWYRGALDVFTFTGSLNASDMSFLGSATVQPIAWNTLPSSSAWQGCEPPAPSKDPLRITLTALAGPTPESLGRVLGADRVFGGLGWHFGIPHPALPVAGQAPCAQSSLGVQVKFGPRSS